MRFVSGSTPEEIRMVTAWQRTVGAAPDNSVGPQTITDTLAKLCADVWPVNVTIFNQPVIIAWDARPAAVNAPLKRYANAVSGSFSYSRKPCSILVADGEVVCGYACHAHLKKPETVLYRLEDGTFGIKKCLYATELPKGVRWAVGGVGLLDEYNPAAEGFTGIYSDVLRRTDHTFLGTKHELVYMGYVKNKTGAEVNAYCKKLGLASAVMLDGGHVAAINAAEDRINTCTTQFYVVQATGGVKNERNTD